MNIPYALSDQEIAWMQALSVLIAFVALLLSVLAIYFTARTYWQKRGALVRGSYTVATSSVATNYKFVSEVILENLKDRPVVIFGVYFRVSRNYLIELESFEDAPFILKPFEAIRRAYDPVDFYEFNMRRIDFNSLFETKRQGHRLVLATTDGKLIVKKPIPMWNPAIDWFNNQLHVTAQIHRVTFHNRGYGSNVLFVVNLFKGEEWIQSIPLYPEEYEGKWFRDLGGDEETLRSTDKVEEMFQTARKEGKIKADRIEVVDAEEARDVWRKLYPELFRKEPFVAKRLSWLFVNVVGRLATWRQSREIKRGNRQRKEKRMQENREQKENGDR